jgi:phage terminase large subunit-like protein
MQLHSGGTSSRPKLAPQPKTEPTPRPRLHVPAGQVIVRETRGDRMIAFIEAFCRVPDGPEVGSLLRLRDWQKSIIKTIYDPEDKNNLRIVREALLTMARKNAKTQLASSLALGHLIGPEALKNSRIYSAAYDREQASIVYNNIANMVLMDQFLESQIRLTESKREAKWAKMGTIYKALSAESRTKHGLNPAFVVMDELGQFGMNRTLYDVLKTSMGVQAEPLMLVISTQAEDDQSLMSEMVDYGREVNSGNIVDPTFRLIEYSVPDQINNKDVNVFDERVWYLANPALDDFRSLAEMRVMAERAKSIPTVKRKFCNLYLNMRVSMSVSITTRETWDANQLAVPEEVYSKCPCCIGIDLSSKKDLTALVLVFQLSNEEYFVKPHFFTPRDTAEERSKLERVPYLDWIDYGLVEAPLGSAIDYAVVARRFLEYLGKYEVVCVAYDRWRMDVLKRELENQNFDPEDGQIGFLSFGQGYKDMSPALETYEQVVGAHKLHHDGHPVLRFNITSAVATGDEAGNRKLDKRNSRAKIDGAVATVMALHAFNRLGELDIQGPSVYNQRAAVVIGGKGETKSKPEAKPAEKRSPNDWFFDYDD